ncbi:MAG: hypothetical protein ACKN9W_08770 [Methylococcus sp.]
MPEALFKPAKRAGLSPIHPNKACFENLLASIHQLFILNNFLTLTHFMKIIQPTPECCNPPAMHTETLINPEGHPVNQSVNG